MKTSIIAPQLLGWMEYPTYLEDEEMAEVWLYFENRGANRDTVEFSLVLNDTVLEDTSETDFSVEVNGKQSQSIYNGIFLANIFPAYRGYYQLILSYYSQNDEREYTITGYFWNLVAGPEEETKGASWAEFGIFLPMIIAFCLLRKIKQLKIINQGKAYEER